MKFDDHLSNNRLCEVMWQITNIKSDLSQYLLSPNFSNWWVTTRKPHPHSLNYVVLWFCFSPMRFIGLECNFLSRYRLLDGVCWKQKAFGFSFILPFLSQTFPEYRGNRSKKVLNRPSNTIRLVVALK